MLPSEELKFIHDKQLHITEEEVYNLFAEFLKISPVDTGAFRSAWDIKNNGDGSWTISNDMDYATILADGRRRVNGKWYGSEQLQEGIDPTLERFKRRLQRKLNKVRI